MTYIYTGVLSEDLYQGDFPSDSKKAVYRKLTHPDLKVGILFPGQADNYTVKPNSDTEELIRLSGIKNGTWVYYVCWGGDIETIALAKVVDCKILMDTYERYDDASYSDLFSIFSKYKIKIEKTGQFSPFERNFWGEYGY